ncbi:unnamed protein product, partial [Rotaria sordida]
NVIYSLVDANERFDRLVLNPLYIHNFDLSTKSLFDDTSSISDQVLDRIYKKVLPRIHQHINKLTVEPHSIEHILLNVNFYPQL